MPRVERPAIGADVAHVAALLDELFIGVVAALAQALQWTKPELVDITAMRLDVVGDSR